MAWLATAAPYLKLAGAGLSVLSNESGARSDASQLRSMAGQDRASSQRAAFEERRRAKLAESRVRAVAAASGAGATDPTVLNIMGDLSAEGEYRALTRMYEGETEAQSKEYQAKQIKRATRGQSISTVLNSGASFFATKYGG